jgi:hypothetical protein
MREAGSRVERATLQGLDDDCVLSRTHLLPARMTGDRTPTSRKGDIPQTALTPRKGDR